MGQKDHVVLRDLLRLDHYADLAAGLNGVGFLNAGEGVRQLFELFEPADIVLDVLTACTGACSGDRVGCLHETGDDGLRLNVAMVRLDGVDDDGVLLVLSGIQDEVAAQNLPFSLEYVIPEEGTNVWLDSWVVPKNAKNKENAEKWINFLCRPDVAVKNFEYITYATPNKAAKEMLDEEIQNNKAVFPDAKQLKNCEVYRYLGDEADELYNSLWKEVKSD